MKILVCFMMLICLSVSAPAIGGASVQNEIADFLEMVPMDKIRKIAIRHLHDDPEFRAAVKYLMSDEFIGMLTELQRQPEVIELKSALVALGIDLDNYNLRLCSFLGNLTIETDTKQRSLKKFIDEIKDTIPTAKLIQTFDVKMKTSPAFKELFEKLSSEEMHQLVAKVRVLPVFKKIVAELMAMGVDINRMFTITYAVFGWSDDIAPTPSV